MASVLVRCGLLATLIAAVGLFGFWAARTRLPADGLVASGLKVGGVVVPDGSLPAEVAETRAAIALDRSITVTHGGAPILKRTARELGASVDVAALGRRIAAVGHETSLSSRLDSALAARRGEMDVPVRLRLPVEALAAALAEHKEELDRRAVPAKLHLSSGEIEAHQDGMYIDLYRTAEEAERALQIGTGEIELATYAESPAASTEAARRIATGAVLSHFETIFSYGQIGRAKNVERAAGLLDGTILMPGEEISFNEIVGARSEENGFHSAPEIYRGEMREGIGGGACQVASTLYAAAFFAGMNIVERVNHSRPSGYIRLGLDATVSYPVLDLKIQNPYDFPVVVASRVDRKGIVRFELAGERKAASVDLATATLGTKSYDRKIRPAPWLPDGEFRLKQKGKRGVTVRRVRTIALPAGGTRVEEDIDHYPPTQEVYLVSPGLDVDGALPPLPTDA